MKRWRKFTSFVAYDARARRARPLLEAAVVLLLTAGQAIPAIPKAAPLVPHVPLILSSALVCAILVLIPSIIVATTSVARRENAQLYLEDRGKLLDRARRIRNVSLRQSTVLKLLASIRKGPTGKNALKIAGREIGLSFVQDIQESEVDQARAGLSLLTYLLAYDKSSGFGLFLSKEAGDDIEITVTDPFTDAGPNTSEPLFLVGYLEGVCEAVYGTKFKGASRKDPQDTSVTIISLRRLS